MWKLIPPTTQELKETSRHKSISAAGNARLSREKRSFAHIFLLRFDKSLSRIILDFIGLSANINGCTLTAFAKLRPDLQELRLQHGILTCVSEFLAVWNDAMTGGCLQQFPIDSLNRRLNRHLNRLAEGGGFPSVHKGLGVIVSTTTPRNPLLTFIMVHVLAFVARKRLSPCLPRCTEITSPPTQVYACQKNGLRACDLTASNSVGFVKRARDTFIPTVFHEDDRMLISVYLIMSDGRSDG